MIRETLRDDSLLPLKRLRAYFVQASLPSRTTIPRRCLVGNFAAEAPIIAKSFVSDCRKSMLNCAEAVAYCLRRGEGRRPSQELQSERNRDFIVTGLQGAFLCPKLSATYVSGKLQRRRSSPPSWLIYQTARRPARQILAVLDRLIQSSTFH